MAYDKVVDSAQMDYELGKTANAMRQKMIENTTQFKWVEADGFATQIQRLQPYIGSGTNFITFSNFASRLSSLTRNSGDSYSSSLQGQCDTLNQVVGASVAQVVQKSVYTGAEPATVYVAKVDISALMIKWA